MASAHDIERIRKYDWPDLQELWDRIVAGETPDWGAGKAMEYVILRAFELDGADVVWPYIVPLRGEQVEQIDGAVYCGSLSCLIESKATTDKVNIEPIAKLRYQLLRRPPGVLGLVFSRSGFTEPALTLAQFMSPLNILLYGPKEIERLLEKREMVGRLMIKYRRCVEHGLPNFDTREVDIP